MRRTIIKSMAAAVLVAALTSCGFMKDDIAVDSSVITESISAVASSEIEETPIEEAIIGRYFCEDGYFLEIKSNGTFVEYNLLYSIDDERSGKWTCDGNNFSFVYSYNDEVITETIYTSDSFDLSWRKYERADKIASAAHAKTTLSDNRKGESFDGYGRLDKQTYTCGGIRFEIPANWHFYDEGAYIAEYNREGTYCLITINDLGVTVSNETDWNAFCKVVDGKTEEMKINGNYTISTKYEEVKNSVLCDVTELYVWNEKTNGVVCISYVATESQMFDYDSDIEKIMYSATSVS